MSTYQVNPNYYFLPSMLLKTIVVEVVGTGLDNTDNIPAEKWENWVADHVHGESYTSNDGLILLALYILTNEIGLILFNSSYGISPYLPIAKELTDTMTPEQLNHLKMGVVTGTLKDYPVNIENVNWPVLVLYSIIVEVVSNLFPQCDDRIIH